MAIQVEQQGGGSGDGQSVAVSPDGRHVYVAGYIDEDAVAVFARDPATGVLGLMEVEREGVGGVRGIKNALSATVSPDGRHVYVSSASAVAVFAREATTGLLSFAGFQADGVGGVDGLSMASSVTVSPDGRHVYVASRSDDALSVFAREATTGALSFVDVYREGVVGESVLDGARSLAVSPDGGHVYVASEVALALAVFAREATTGTLGLVQADLRFLSGIGFLRPASVAVSPDGQHVYLASSLLFQRGAIEVFARGAVTGALTFVEAEVDGVDAVDGLAGAQSVTVSPDGRHIYVVSGDPRQDREGAVAVFAREAVTGAISFLQVEERVGGVDGLRTPQSVTVSPDGKHVYVPGVDDRSRDPVVAVFEREEATGALHPLGVVREGLRVLAGERNLPELVTVSPDGRHAYVVINVERGLAPPVGSAVAAIAVFAREAATGLLDFVDIYHYDAGGIEALDDGIQSAILSADGKHLYVAENRASGPGSAGDRGTLVVFMRDAQTGALTFVAALGGVVNVDLSDQPVALSPDGKHVYVPGGPNEDAVALFSRNTTTGMLTFVELERRSLDEPAAVTVSPDGRYAYVIDTRAVVVFERAATSGTLRFVEIHRDGQDGVDGLSGASSVTMSPGGQYLYIRSFEGIVVFARAAATGTLDFVAVQQDVASGFSEDFEVSPDGRHVYVTAPSSVAAYRVNAQ